MPDDFKRISEEDVLAAYRSTGKKPVRGHWVTNGCACGGGVLALAKGIALDGDYDIPLVAGLLGLDGVYFGGFVRGFDGFTAWLYDEASLIFRTGFSDGERIASRVFAELAPERQPATN